MRFILLKRVFWNIVSSFNLFKVLKSSHNYKRWNMSWGCEWVWVTLHLLTFTRDHTLKIVIRKERKPNRQISLAPFWIFWNLYKSLFFHFMRNHDKLPEVQQVISIKREFWTWKRENIKVIILTEHVLLKMCIEKDFLIVIISRKCVKFSSVENTELRMCFSFVYRSKSV